MNRIEDLLRQAYQEAAQTVSGETVRQVVALPVAGQRRPVPMRLGRTVPMRLGRTAPMRPVLMSFAPLAAAVAVVVIIAAAIAVPRLLPSGRVPHTTVAGSASPPPFLVQLPYTGASNAPLVVQAATAHRVTGTLPPPPHSAWRAVAARGDAGAFVAAASDAATCSTRIYTFIVTTTGTPTGLAPFGTVITGELPSNDSLAASANGGAVAYGFTNCLPRVSTGIPFESIGLMRANGIARQWSLPPTAALGSLSLSADGRTLAFEEQAPLANGSAVQILATRSPSGSTATTGRLVLGRHGAASPASAAISPDGTTIYITTRTSTGQGTTTLAEYRTNGTLLRTLHTWRDTSIGYSAGITEGGDKLLVWGIYQPGTFEVDPATGNTTPLWMYTPDGEFPESVAW
jgi:hypothetical protein